MPTVLRIGPYRGFAPKVSLEPCRKAEEINYQHLSDFWCKAPYRIYFHSHEPNEPPHVHVDREAFSAKFWLNPVSHARNVGFSARELRQIDKLIREHRTELLEAWNGYFGISS
jgi:hypothetical protein